MAVEWEARERVGVVTIYRPERRNALDADHCDQLRGALEAAEGNDELRVIVLTGAGTAFCAGADLAARFDGGDPFHAVLQRMLDAVSDHRLPVIAAVHGAALGAGTQLATACDLRVAGRDAVFGIPAAHLGIMISAASTERLVRLVGYGHATEMLLTGRRYTAGQALAIGLAHRLTDSPLDDALAWAHEIGELAPLSVQGHKRSLRLIGEVASLAATSHAEIAALIDAAVASHDLREGVAAFNQKRPPRFEGR